MVRLMNEPGRTKVAKVSRRQLSSIIVARLRDMRGK